MLQETASSEIWSGSPSLLSWGTQESKGGGSVSPLFFHSLLCLCTPPATHSRIEWMHVDTHKPVCADRPTEEKVADDIFFFGGGAGPLVWRYTTHCYIVVQSNDSERTRHISMQPPSTQHALLPRSSGTTLWPTSEGEGEKQQERRDRARGRTLRKNREHKMSGSVMSDRNGANLSLRGELKFGSSPKSPLLHFSFSFLLFSPKINLPI